MNWYRELFNKIFRIPMGGAIYEGIVTDVEMSFDTGGATELTIKWRLFGKPKLNTSKPKALPPPAEPPPKRLEQHDVIDVEVL